jgi:hypothetical protein
LPHTGVVAGVYIINAGLEAIQFSDYSGPEVLQIVEIEEPQAGAGQARINEPASYGLQNAARINICNGA